MWDDGACGRVSSSGCYAVIDILISTYIKRKSEEIIV